jgi:hypothetical protein
MVAQSKPAPDLFLHAAQQHGNVEITGRDVREKTPPVGQGRLFETGDARPMVSI